MTTLTHFTQLDAWKINHEVALKIYSLTQNFPSNERFGIIDQLRRAASSVTANIAEGWGRFHYQDKIRFYYQARGSNCEVQNFLILSKDLGYISESENKTVLEKVTRGGQVINGLIRLTEKYKNSE